MTDNNDSSISIDSRDSRFGLYTTIVFLLTGLLTLYAGYSLCTADIDWGFDIDWNCFNSPKSYGTLCVVGFFLQFLKGGWRHESREEYVAGFDSNGNRVTEWERNDDVMTVLFNKVVWPLISHLFLTPMIYGAAMWYTLMGAIALIGKMTPYLISLALIAMVVYCYLAVRKRTDSYAWLVGTSLMCVVINAAAIAAISSDFSFFADNVDSTAVNETYRAVEVTGQSVNLRLGPGTEFDRYSMQAAQGDILEVIDVQGEWYRVSYNGNDNLWIHSRFCQDYTFGDDDDPGCGTEEEVTSMEEEEIAPFAAELPQEETITQESAVDDTDITETVTAETDSTAVPGEF